MVGFTADGPARDRVLQLIAEKDRMESEIRDQSAILVAEGNVGLHGPLVDDQGFPRSDIDVYKVRHARHRIICLQNDHKTIMKRIEQGLAEVHSEFLPGANNGQATTSTTINGHTNGHSSNGHRNGNHSSGDSMEELPQAFAKVGLVQHGSPADLDGVRIDDEILQFGSITPSNFRDVTQINDIVSHSVGQSVRVLVRRDDSVHSLSVTPRRWSQPGLLGCQINQIHRLR